MDKYLSQSELVRPIVARLFPQDENVENSKVPIYVNYSIPFSDVDKERVMIYDANALSPQYFLGDKDILRNQGITVIVAHKDSKVAYDRSNLIMDFLTTIKQYGEIVSIRAIEDIEPIGFNPKKYYLYKCNYIITRIK